MGGSRRRWAVTLAISLGIWLLSAPPAAASSALQILLNQDRAANGGLPPLQWSDCLASVALANAQRIAAQGYLTHTDGPKNDMACGIGSTRAGENIAWLGAGINDAKVNDMYMNSAPHRANILGQYNYVGTAWVVAPNGYAYNAIEFLNASSLLPPLPTVNAFYFAEGWTGPGFTEKLSILMPKQAGTATIDYYTRSGHLPTINLALAAGKVTVRDVNADVGVGQEVSAIVVLSGPGVVERTLNFNSGNWRGSTDIVGASQPQTEWDFAEGSTLPMFDEYLALQNPNPVPVVVTLNYATDMGAHPVKKLGLAPSSRTTLGVFDGDLSNNLNCVPGNCGVGRGVVGVSVQAKSLLPIIAERPFYVAGYSFGSGVIHDGHVAFGANAPATQWNFAEGTTLKGFNEYLTLQNPGSTPANVTLKYIHDLGTTTRNLVVNGQSRATVLVFDQAHNGVAPGLVGVSVQVSSDQPIVAERPMYVVWDFGTGPVAGAHVVVGSTSLNKVFGFSAASTLAGDNDYLTIQNPGGVAANLTIDYYTPSGKLTRTFAVPPTSRHTVLVFANNGEGAGPSLYPLGVVVSSDQPVLVEKPTYSSNPSTYGATDTLGYTPAASF